MQTRKLTNKTKKSKHNSQLSSAKPKEIGQKKQAKQSRSKQTIENILIATAELIQTIGIEKLTTNKVAERSGVNIGSIYQYFPNKESLVIALTNKLMNENSEKIQTLIKNLQGTTIQNATRAVISTGIELYRDTEGLLFNLYVHADKPDILGSKPLYLQTIILPGKQFLLEHKQELRVKNIDRSLYLLTNSVLPAIYRYLVDDPQDISDHEFTEEIVDLVSGYLC